MRHPVALLALVVAVASATAGDDGADPSHSVAQVAHTVRSLGSVLADFAHPHIVPRVDGGGSWTEVADYGINRTLALARWAAQCRTGPTTDGSSPSCASKGDPYTYPVRRANRALDNDNDGDNRFASGADAVMGEWTPAGPLHRALGAVSSAGRLYDTIAASHREGVTFRDATEAAMREARLRDGREYRGPLATGRRRKSSNGAQHAAPSASQQHPEQQQQQQAQRRMQRAQSTDNAAMSDSIMVAVSDATRTISCHDGVTVVTLENSTFVCNASSASPANVTADEYRTMSPAQRANCTYNEGSGSSTCLCPKDRFLFRSVSRVVGCLPRNVTCETQLLDLNCHAPAYAEPESDLPHCYDRLRTQDAQLRVKIVCRNSDKVSTVPFQSIGAVALTVKNDTVFVVTANTTLAAQPAGLYTDLAGSTALFPNFVVSTANLSLTATHPLILYGSIESQLFDFDRPSRKDQQRVWPLATTQLARESLALGVWSTTYALASVPAHYIIGGRVYAEIGVVSPHGLEDRYSVSRLQIDITNAAQPTGVREYPKRLDAGSVALIAIGVSLVVGLVLVVLWKLWRRETHEDVAMPGVDAKKRKTVSK